MLGACCVLVVCLLCALPGTATLGISQHSTNKQQTIANKVWGPALCFTTKKELCCVNCGCLLCACFARYHRHLAKYPNLTKKQLWRSIIMTSICVESCGPKWAHQFAKGSPAKAQIWTKFDYSKIAPPRHHRHLVSQLSPRAATLGI